jgi:hypothetical protein
MMMLIRDHDQECKHGNTLSHRLKSGQGHCPGGAEVKGPQFTPPWSATLAAHWLNRSDETWDLGIAVAKGVRYQIIELDPIDLGPGTREIEEAVAAASGQAINPFGTLVTLEYAKVIDDAVKAEVTRQMQEWAPDDQAIQRVVTAEVKRQLTPAIIAAMTRTTWQLNADEAF